MSFKHTLLPIIELKNIDLPDGRIYKTPIGMLPSVTNVLDKHADKRGLESWKEWIGHDVADQILQQAKVRGHAVHKLCEDYLRNRCDWRKGAMPVNLDSFLKIKPLLDANVKEVYGIELPLYSKKLQTAGRTDGVVNWSTVPVILDYKTSLKPVHPEAPKALKWKLQTACYAMLLEEEFGMTCNHCVIVVLVDNEEAQIFQIDNREYRAEVTKIFTHR